jgi:pimeloyl-ACP methyl ester carboxylesterase
LSGHLEANKLLRCDNLFYEGLQLGINRVFAVTSIPGHIMLPPRLHHVTCSSPAGLHRMAYYDWGDPDCEDVVLCVHGLTRTGRDFDALADVLSSRFRVICPDVVGRGLSDWLSHPSFYTLAQYTSDMVTLLSRIQPRRLHWVGTSMGGLIGLVFASAIAQYRIKSAFLTPAQHFSALQEINIRLDSLVLNDVGPHIEPASLERIGQYVGEAVSFSCFEHAVEYVQSTCASFGPHTPEQWRDLTRYVYIEQAGRWIKHYDLALAAGFRTLNPELAAQGEALLWAAFSSLTVPIQIIRGRQSDLLSEKTCQKLLEHQPSARLTQIEGVGHAPTLMDAHQIAVVSDFLFSLSCNAS